MNIELAHAFIKAQVMALAVTTYAGDDEHARTFRLHQAERLLDTTDPRVREAIEVIRAGRKPVDVVFTTDEGCRVRALTLPPGHPAEGSILLELRMMQPDDGSQAAIILKPEEWAKLTGAGS